MSEWGLPSWLRDEGEEIPYTAAQLEPTLRRLVAAVEVDLRREGSAALGLAAAWARVAELRFPRKAVPRSVVEAIEDLVLEWDRFPGTGFTSYALSLTPEQVEAERNRISWMLAQTRQAAARDWPVELLPTE